MKDAKIEELNRTIAENQSKYDAEITSKTKLLEESDVKQSELSK